MAYILKSYADVLIPHPHIGYIVDQVIQSGSLNIFYGYPGVMKSALVMDMAFAVATGQPWLPSMPGTPTNVGRKTIQTPVVWCDIDNGEYLTEERIRAFGSVYGGGAATPFYFMPYPDIKAISYSSMVSLTSFIVSTGLTRPLIVIDTLLRAARVRDENSSELDTVMYNLRLMNEVLHSTMVLISHSNKVNNGRAGNALRGHSSIEGGVDSVFRVSRENNADVVDITNEKARRKPVAPFSARWTFTSDPVSDELLTARFYISDTAKVNKTQQAQSTLMSRIRELLLDQGKMNKSEIYSQIRGSRPTFEAAIVQAVQDGHIFEIPGLFNNSKVYDAK